MEICTEPHRVDHATRLSRWLGHIGGDSLDLDARETGARIIEERGLVERACAHARVERDLRRRRAELAVAACEKEGEACPVTHAILRVDLLKRIACLANAFDPAAQAFELAALGDAIELVGLHEVAKLCRDESVVERGCAKAQTRRRRRPPDATKRSATTDPWDGTSCPAAHDAVTYYLLRRATVHRIDTDLSDQDIGDLLVEDACDIATHLADHGRFMEQLHDRELLPVAEPVLHEECERVAAAWSKRSGNILENHLGACATAATDKIIKIITAGTPPSRAGLRTAVLLRGVPNEYVFISPFHAWRARIVRTTAVDFVRQLHKTRWPPPLFSALHRQLRALDRNPMKLGELIDHLRAVIALSADFDRTSATEARFLLALLDLLVEELESLPAWLERVAAYRRAGKPGCVAWWSLRATHRLKPATISALEHVGGPSLATGEPTVGGELEIAAKCRLMIRAADLEADEIVEALCGNVQSHRHNARRHLDDDDAVTRRLIAKYL